MTLLPLPPPNVRLVEPDGTPSLVFRQYMLSLDTAVRALLKGSLGALPSAANDAAAAGVGVKVGDLYQTNGAVKIRLA